MRTSARVKMPAAVPGDDDATQPIPQRRLQSAPYRSIYQQLRDAARVAGIVEGYIEGVRDRGVN
jgi:hypothetical protein